MIGLDYYRTITAKPKLFKKLAEAYLAAGIPVYIITAVKRNNITPTLDSIKRSRVPCTAIEFVVFEDFEEIPQLKLAVCQRLGIKLMYDDLEEVTELLAKHRILTALIR